MAKVFTIDIPYKSASYPALVTVRSIDKNQSVHVHFFDDGILQYLPEGELYFTIGSSVRATGVASQPRNSELYHSIRDVVFNYLKSGAVYRS